MLQVKPFYWPPERLQAMTQIGKVQYLVIHHTASSDLSAEAIDEMHVHSRGYSGIAYHYVIRKSGAIEKGRPDNVSGAHAKGFNHISLGIALTGDFTKHYPTKEQMQSLFDLVLYLKQKYPGVRVVRHSDLIATACPGNLFPWEEFKAMINMPQVSGTVNVKFEDNELQGYIINDRTYCEVRRLCELLGLQVKWDASTKTVAIER